MIYIYFSVRIDPYFYSLCHLYEILERADDVLKMTSHL